MTSVRGSSLAAVASSRRSACDHLPLRAASAVREPPARARRNVDRRGAHLRPAGRRALRTALRRRRRLRLVLLQPHAGTLQLALAAALWAAVLASAHPLREARRSLDPRRRDARRDRGRHARDARQACRRRRARASPPQGCSTPSSSMPLPASGSSTTISGTSASTSRSRRSSAARARRDRRHDAARARAHERTRSSHCSRRCSRSGEPCSGSRSRTQTGSGTPRQLLPR